MSALAGWQTTQYIIDPNKPVVPQYMDYALSQVVAAYSSLGLQLPERRYWTVGQEAADCQQVVLAVQGAQLGLAGAPTLTTECEGPVSLSFTAQIMRCTPVANSRGAAPSPEVIQSHSVAVATDLEVMLYYLPARFDAYRTGITASAAAAGAEGGLMGAVGTYTVNL